MPMVAQRPVADAATYERIIRERHGDLAEDFLRRYPSHDMQESIYAATRDGIHGWTSERLAISQTALGVSAFLYLFDHSYPAADAAGLHAFHASELPFLFGTLETTPVNWPPIPNDSKQTNLSEAMIGYWTSFARSGAPRAAKAALTCCLQILHARRRGSIPACMNISKRSSAGAGARAKPGAGVTASLRQHCPAPAPNAANASAPRNPRP
jgi:hypothetical protein